MARPQALRLWRTSRAFHDVSSPSSALNPRFSSNTGLPLSEPPFTACENPRSIDNLYRHRGHVSPCHSSRSFFRNHNSSDALTESIPPSSSLLLPMSASTLRGTSSLELRVSRVLDEVEHRMVSWNGRRYQHVSTAEESKPAEETGQEGITLTDSCIQRIYEIKKEEGSQGENKMLRLSVEGGGCSGFLYNFSLEDKQNKDDRVFERGGAKIVVDEISYGFVRGATVDYTEELIRASFAVTVNPNAATACGCGSSFNAK